MFFEIANYFFEKEKLLGFENKLQMNESKSSSVEKFLEKSFSAGAVLTLLGVLVLGLQKTDILFITLVCSALFFVPLLANYFFQEYCFESNKRKKEKLVPDLLLQASVFPAGTDIIAIIKYIGNSDFGLLSKDFRQAYLAILKGASVEKALEKVKKTNQSRVIDRGINLLIQGYCSGADMGLVFREAAEDILETQSLLRERVSTMVIEKYTLLFAGGLIVPLILGLLVGMVNGMGFASIEGLSFGIAIQERRELLSMALAANNFYIIEYALLASIFVAQQENNLKKAMLYAVFLVPASFICYTLASTPPSLS